MQPRELAEKRFFLHYVGAVCLCLIELALALFTKHVLNSILHYFLGSGVSGKPWRVRFRLVVWSWGREEFTKLCWSKAGVEDGRKTDGTTRERERSNVHSAFHHSRGDG